MLLPLSLAQAGETFHSQTLTLDNGMQIVLIPNDRAPVVTHMVWYKVGAADEPSGLSGMAHYLEHLMFKGTKKQKPGEFSRIVRSLGGNDNAFTSQDFTAYFQSISKDHLELVMTLEADRMRNLAPPADHFTSEKKVVIEERRQRTDNDPSNRFQEQLNSALYINHPYGLPVIGWLNEMERYEWKDIKAFYDKLYAPNNAILVVSGDVTFEELTRLAKKTYGKIPSKDIAERVRPQVPSLDAKTVITKNHPSIHQPVLHKVFLAPSYRQNPQHSLGLQVLNEVLDGGAATLLYRTLVVEQQKATSVSMYYNSNAFDYSNIHIAATPAAGVSLTDLETAIDDTLTAFLEKGPNADDVNAAIARLQDKAIFARDSVSGPAMIVGRALTTGTKLDELEKWPENIGLVSPTIVHEVAKEYLDERSPWIRPPVIGYLMPENTSEGDK